MAPVVFVVDMGVHSRRCVKEIEEDLMVIPGVVEVIASLVLGHVAIIAMADAAMLKARLEATLRRPVFLLADFGAAPAPPVVGGHQPYVYYNPYVVYNQPRYARPPQQAGYCYSPFGGRYHCPGAGYPRHSC